MKTKMKKYLLITALCAVSLIMVVLIGVQFKTDKPVYEPTLYEDEEINDDLIINPGDITTTKDAIEIKPEITVNPTIPANDQSGQAANTGTNQTIQPDLEKPDPDEEQLTDATQTPNGQKVDTPVTEVNNDKNNKPPETPAPAPAPDEPQGGDKQDGKIYIPGFGWIEDEGGGGQGETVDSDGDPNKMVGTM